MYVDPSGQSILAAFLIGVFVGGLFGAIEGGISAKVQGRDVGWGAFLGAVGGGIVGGLAGFFGGSVALKGIKLLKAVVAVSSLSFVVGGITEYCNQKINGETTNLANIIYSGVKSGISNGFSFLFANYVSPLAKDAFDIFGTTLGISIIFFGVNLLFNTKDFYDYGKKLKEKY